ncbi:hypothetical protein PG985_002105 [Apiospora marii]|uniref:Uncharacterized protein n=1 Tax=Apiospora marii TaxID=335849 RepID=A0ABR1RYU2_9PEZI
MCLGLDLLHSPEKRRTDEGWALEVVEANGLIRNARLPCPPNIPFLLVCVVEQNLAFAADGEWPRTLYKRTSRLATPFLLAPVLPPFGRQASRQDPEKDHAHGGDYGACAGMARGNARVRLARVNRLGGLVNKLMEAGFQVLYRRMRRSSNLAREGMPRHVREVGQ